MHRLEPSREPDRRPQHGLPRRRRGQPIEARHPRIDPRLIEALVQHRFTHHTRELERLLWLSVSSSRDGFLGLTSEVRAELRTEAPRDSAPVDEIDADRVRAALAQSGGACRPRRARWGSRTASRCTG